MKTPEQLSEELVKESKRFQRYFMAGMRALNIAKQSQKRCRQIEKRLEQALDQVEKEKEAKRQARQARRNLFHNDLPPEQSGPHDFDTGHPN